MLSKAQEKIILSLHTKKGRSKYNMCLLEGHKIIQEAGDFVEFTFNEEDSKMFNKLVTTETPQDMAAVAKIPKWNLDDVKKSETIVVLDGVQDPGNVGTILRLCLGFDATLILVECADVTSSKVIRSSAGAFFNVAWMQVKRDTAEALIDDLGRDVYRIEKRDGGKNVEAINSGQKVLIAGSEGSGLKLETEGTSIAIDQNDKLESLNVANAIAILLYSIYKN